LISYDRRVPRTEFRHSDIETSGLRMHVVEAGPADGDVVLMCHGFPESWYSWRHQLDALSAAGYRAIAPDMRGYGGTDAPDDVRTYSTLHHVGDMVGLLDALGTDTAVIVGHDWGAPVAWHAAALRPDRFRAVAALSVPWQTRGPVAPIPVMRMIFGGQWFYFVYFQEPGVAEAELDPNAEEFLRNFLFTLSGDAPGDILRGLTGEDDGRGILPRLAAPDVLPDWLTAADVAFYAGEFARTGFRGGLNWYRCTDLSWELSAAYGDLRVHQPALFVAGDRDAVIGMFAGGVAALAEEVPGLRASIMLSGCGHWTQQERPAEVNEALLEFLATL
jgi:pimeloyl-ACP methyl ester carboxylesterase